MEGIKICVWLQLGPRGWDLGSEAGVWVIWLRFKPQGLVFGLSLEALLGFGF